MATARKAAKGRAATASRRGGLDPQSIRLCDCAGCGRVVYGESEFDRLTDYHPDRLEKLLGHAVHGYATRVNGRPYCRECVRGVS